MRFILLFIFYINFLNASIILEDTTNKIDRFEMAYFYDESASLGIDEISKRDFSQSILNSFALGYVQGTSWFKISLQNNTSHEDFILNFSEPWLDIVNVYSFEEGKAIEEKNGLSVTLSDKKIADTTPTFLLNIKKRENKIFYIKLQGRLTSFGKFTIYEDKAAYMKDRLISISQYTMYFGGALVIVLLNLFLFFTLKEKVYIYYSLYVFALSIFIMQMSGISGYMAYDYYYELNFSSSLGTLFFILFSKEILNTSQYTPRVNQMLNYFAGLFFIFTFLLIIDASRWYDIYSLFYLLCVMLISYASLVSWKKGSLDAKYYIVFLLIYISAITLLSLVSFSLVEYTFLTRYTFMYASFFEISFFALVLANKFNKTKIEKLLIETALKSKEIQASELEEITYLDPLTGLYNRRYLSKYLDKLLDKIKINKDDFCFLMLDIDKFKMVNDTYGHLVGDMILTNIGKILNTFSREDDLMIRYGGEEFLVVLANTDITNAKNIAERIRERVEALNTIYEKNKLLKVTISIGISQLGLEDSSPDSAIARADKGLYKSKNEGRNRVSVY